MAITTNGNNQYLSATASPLGTGQLGDHTIAFWVRGASQNATTLLSISRSTETSFTNNPAISVVAQSTRIRYFVRSNAANFWFDLSGSTGQTVLNNTWNHCAVRLSGTTAATFGNGIQSEAATGFTVLTTTGLDRLGIGAFVRGNVLTYSAANFAEVGIWSAAITADEIASLARGVSPSLVRPQSLVFYAPLIREIRDVRGGLALTNNNAATVADHPRVYT